MKILPLQTNLPVAPAGAHNLAVNQLVSGRVLGSLPTGQVLLTLAGHHYKATMQGGRLLPGQDATFRVVQTSPKLALTLVRAPGSKAADHASGVAVSGIQPGNVPDPGTALLSLLGNGSISAWPGFTPLLQVLVQNFRQRTLQGSLSGKAIRQQFLASGLFFDALTTPGKSQMIDTGYHPLRDLKLLVYLLAREAGIISRNFNDLAPGDSAKAYKLHKAGQYRGNVAASHEKLATGNHSLLACLAQENLERIQANQARSLEGHQGGEPVWHFDLHVTLLAEQLSIPVTIRQENGLENGHREYAPGKTWRIGFSVDSSALGLIRTDIRVNAGQVHACIQAASPKTVSRLQGRQSCLEDRFASAGLTLALTVIELQPEAETHEHA